jgi:hypothetical protein
MTTEEKNPYVVWLLEVVNSPPSGALYYKCYGRPIDGGRDDIHVTNPDYLQAMRFSSEQSAKDYAESYGLSDQLVPRDHMFGCQT